jgi:hypothetical protein
MDRTRGKHNTNKKRRLCVFVHDSYREKKDEITTKRIGPLILDAGLCGWVESGLGRV